MSEEKIEPKAVVAELIIRKDYAEVASAKLTIGFDLTEPEISRRLSKAVAALLPSSTVDEPELNHEGARGVTFWR